MYIKKLKTKNGCSLLQYPSGTYGIEYTNAAYGFGMRYTDNKTAALRFFNKVSADDEYNPRHKKQTSKKRNFRIKFW